MGRRKVGGVGALVCSVLLVAPGAKAAPPPTGVPESVPGPTWLHAAAATTPVLENVGGWTAAPLLVSGADAYDSGEYLYQDWVHDNYGANTTDAPMVPPDTSPSTITGLASAPTGDVAQPTDARFANDAGDLLEVRTRPVHDGVALRFTLNAMVDPTANAVAVGIDADNDPSTGSDDWGAGIGSLGHLGLDHVLVVSGTTATLDGQPISAPSIDTARNQIDVTLPLQPHGETWREYVIAGVADGAGGFAAVQELPDAAHPGGAHGTTPPPVLNVGFRRADQEPMGVDNAHLGARGAYGYGSWRYHAQAIALAARDISAFHADIDFDRLDHHVRESHVPTSGFMDRLYVSHLDLGEGVVPAAQPGGSDVLAGPVQPYALYVPDDLDPSKPAPFALLLHAAACNYNQYGVQAPQLLTGLGDDRHGIVATSEARGQTVGYSGIGEVDTFEVWADVARLYALDFDRVVLTGISMGGIGSFRLATLYPDLFTKVFPIAGHGNDVVDIAENVRNVPMMMWNSVADELVRVDEYLPFQQRLEALGYRHEQDIFPTHDHLVQPLGSGTDFSRAMKFLGTDAIDRDPAHVTYRVIPSMANPALGLSYDRAYWVSGIAVGQGLAQGTVDVVDLASGEGAPIVTVFTRPGTDPDPHVARGVEWTSTAAPRTNGVSATLTGIDAVALDLARTSIRSSAPVTVQVTTDRPVRVRLLGLPHGPVVLDLPAGTTTRIV